MALSFIPRLTTHLSLISLVFLFVLPMPIFLTHAAPIEKYGSEKEFELKYYIMIIKSGPNATTIPVAGVAGERWAPTTWGTILVGDTPVVESPTPYSQRVGRSRGIAVSTSKDGRYEYISTSTMFTSGEYKGSTLQKQGTFNRPSKRPSELSIVGGTGKFKGARGISTLQTYSDSNSYTFIRVTFIFSILI